MHIKHYHSEYTELLVSTPNVTDLATARIEGENIDELSPSYFLHRISQLEAKKSWGGNTSYEAPSPSVISSSLKLTELVFTYLFTISCLMIKNNYFIKNLHTFNVKKKIFYRPEIGSNTSLNSENYNTSFTSNDQPNNITHTYDSK